jgi:hypothetical protein
MMNIIGIKNEDLLIDIINSNFFFIRKGGEIIN